MVETFSSVPKVDYSRLKSPKTKDDELLKLREAIFVVGFLYLTNTGLEVRVIVIVVQFPRGGTDQVVGSYPPNPRGIAAAFCSPSGHKGGMQHDKLSIFLRIY
jgi:hypothetical protein